MGRAPTARAAFDAARAVARLILGQTGVELTLLGETMAPPWDAIVFITAIGGASN